MSLFSWSLATRDPICLSRRFDRSAAAPRRCYRTTTGSHRRAGWQSPMWPATALGLTSLPEGYGWATAIRCNSSTTSWAPWPSTYGASIRPNCKLLKGTQQGRVGNAAVLSRRYQKPGQPHAPAGAAAECEAVVAHDAARQADQDRGEGCSSRPVRHVSTGRGRGAAPAVPGDPRADTTVRGPPATGITDMTVPTAHQPSQQRGAWDVTSPRSRRSGPPGPRARSLCPPRDPFSMQTSSPREQIGLQCREAALCWSETDRRWSRAQVKWGMSV